MQYIHEQKHLVTDCEVDAQGFWKIAETFRLMQDIAGVHAMSLGVGRDITIEKNAAWVLMRAKVDFDVSVKVWENLTIRTWPTANMRTIFPRHYAFIAQDGTEVGHATTLWTLLDVEKRAMTKMETIGLAMPDLSEQPEGFAQPSVLSKPLGHASEMERQVLYSDIDINGHMNNARYVQWVCDLVLREQHKKVRSVQVNYLSEAKPGERLRLLFDKEPEGYRVHGKIEGRQMDVFHARLITEA